MYKKLFISISLVTTNLFTAQFSTLSTLTPKRVELQSKKTNNDSFFGTPEIYTRRFTDEDLSPISASGRSPVDDARDALKIAEQQLENKRIAYLAAVAQEQEERTKQDEETAKQEAQRVKAENELIKKRLVFVQTSIALQLRPYVNQAVKCPYIPGTSFNAATGKTCEIE